MNPEKFLVRYQFLELLVHLAKERYRNQLKSGVQRFKFDEALKLIMHQNLKPLLDNHEKFDPQEFRDNKLWN